MYDVLHAVDPLADRALDDDGSTSVHPVTAPITVHVGYWKTATTTLQSDVFPRVAGCTFLTRSRVGNGQLVGALANNLCRADDAHFLGATLGSFLREVAVPGLPTLLSHEAFAGAAFQAMYNRDRNAERLHRVLPSASILVVVRHQRTMLRSLYNYYVQRGGHASLAEFLGGNVPGCDFRLEALWYDETVALYQGLFGAGRVKVIPYELLTTAPSRFLTEVLEFIGVVAPSPESASRVANRGLSRPSRWVLRGTNRLFRSSVFNEHPLVGPLANDGPVHLLQRRVDPRFVPDAMRGFSAADEARLDSVMASFVESNRRLEQLCGPLVASFEYPGTGSRKASVDGVASA